ncbi:MAG: hypothetical protein MN733_37630, partial [Nitrososphaera sp.]|nr:hypothetical protein [Nitrososphaera sp.]
MTTEKFMKSNLIAALAVAQRSIGPIPHDSKEEFGYTSAEAIIAKAKEALISAGLILIREHEYSEDWLCNTFRLYHIESGEDKIFKSFFPIVSTDRPKDWAVGTALT